MSRGPWRLARLLTAPHRLGFFAAAAAMAVSAAWWAIALALSAAGFELPWAVPQPIAHSLAMAFSFMPLFIVGFAFTAGPRWLGLPDVPAPSLLKPVVAMGGGWALAVAGFHLAAPLAAAGVALACGGWMALLLRLARLIAASPMPDTMHARGVLAAGLAGALAMALAALALALAWPDVARAAVRIAIWGFLAATFATVSHRMLPFFTASALPFVEAWRPNWLLAAMLATLGLTGLVDAAEVLWWPLPAVLHAVMAVLHASAAALMLWLAWRWGLVPSMRVRLLAMLHAAFVWLGLALVLAACSHARVAWLGDGASLGLAPVHALAIGYLGATLIAMITRVAAGHSGRPLAADNLALVLYLAVHVAAVLRVAASLRHAAGTALTLVAVAAWALGCIGWALRYGSWLGRPRADGRPG
ncbi:MAG: NnrS family protein [Aquincola sp.]|nr:NnrS family protein [Aquincola sp.]